MEICVAAGDGDHHFVVGFENDHIVGHFADDVAEQAGVENDGIKLIFNVLLILSLSYSGENVSYDTLPL